MASPLPPRYRLALAVALGLGSLAPPAGAEHLVARLDAAASVVRFSVGATMHSVHGTLKIVEGALDADTSTHAASGRVILDMTSADTGIDRRDRKLQGKVLQASRFPQATFTIDRMTGDFAAQGECDVSLRGALELLGVRHEVSLPLHARVAGESFTARGDLTVPYVEWGLTDPSFLILRVGKEVRVEVEVSGSLRPGPES